MIPLIGHQILYVAFAMTLFTIVVTFSAQWKSIVAGDVGLISPNALRWLDVARNGAIAMCVLVTMASVLLEYLFLTNNFAVQAVWDHSAIAQPLFYKAVAFWGGMSGSMLLWAQILAVCSVVLAQTDPAFWVVWTRHWSLVATLWLTVLSGFHYLWRSGQRLGSPVATQIDVS